MPIKTRSPFVLDYSRQELQDIRNSLDYLLRQLPDCIREDYYAQDAIDFTQDLSDAIKDYPPVDINPDDYFPKPVSAPVETPEQRRLRIWNIATPTQRRRLEIRGQKPAESLYQIWSEGFVSQGETGKAKCMGSAIGTNFSACAKLAEQNPQFGDLFNPITLTWWGCRLFDNEADARKSFG